jgi:hypothetical protein
MFRDITNAPCYVTNHTLHKNFNILHVSDVILERINKNSNNNLEAHPNPLSATTTTNKHQKTRKMLVFRLTGHLR